MTDENVRRTLFFGRWRRLTQSREPKANTERDNMLTADKVLDHYYLDTRCMLIEIAALLDRYDRAVDRAWGGRERG